MILAIFKVHYHQHRDLPPTSQFGETIKIIATGLVKVSWLWSFNHKIFSETFLSKQMAERLGAKKYINDCGPEHISF